MGRYRKKIVKKVESGHDLSRTLPTNSKSGQGKEMTTDLELNLDRVSSKKEKVWLNNTQLLFPAEVFKITNFFPLIISLFSLYISFIDVLISLLQYDVLIDGDSTLIASVKCFRMAAATMCSALIYSPKNNKKVWFKESIDCLCCLLFREIIISLENRKADNEYWK